MPSVPGRPESLKHLRVGDTWALLSWSQPHHPNGVIEAYYLYFDRDNSSFTDNRVVRGVRPQMTYNLTRLGEDRLSYDFVDVVRLDASNKYE